jgi:hypothetical protein
MQNRTDTFQKRITLQKSRRFNRQPKQIIGSTCFLNNILINIQRIFRDLRVSVRRVHLCLLSNTVTSLNK